MGTEQDGDREVVLLQKRLLPLYGTPILQRKKAEEKAGTDFLQFHGDLCTEASTECDL